ncbi:MAG: hypothetical protein P8J86_01880 [Phycisphaerales bacterium]|nr:hypothetical protein [Phycisphaerales bacterium]
MNTWLYTITVLILLTSFLGSWGCQSSTQKQALENKDATGVWTLWPKSMRVHPLTRVINQADMSPPVVELRVEFMDPTGDPIKSTGQMAITYSDSTGRVRNAPPLGLWETDLRDLSTNQAHWDDVTDTYLYRFPLPNTATNENGMLRVIMLQEDGQQFDDVFALEIPPATKAGNTQTTSQTVPSEVPEKIESKVLKQAMIDAMLYLRENEPGEQDADSVPSQTERAIVEIREDMPDFLIVSKETEQKLQAGTSVIGADERIAAASASLMDFEVVLSRLVVFLLENYEAGNLSPIQTELLAQLMSANVKQAENAFLSN